MNFDDILSSITPFIDKMAELIWNKFLWIIGIGLLLIYLLYKTLVG